MWMEDDEPHCSFQSLSLRHGVTWNRYIWGKDGPCSTWPSLDSLQTGTVQPFRGWIQVFSPNHPPKKVLAAGYQWYFLAGYPNIKSITHPDGCGYPCHHGILWRTQQNSWWMDVPHVHPFKIRYKMVLNHPQIWELPTVQRDARQSNGSRTDFSTYSTWGQCCLVTAADFSAKIIHAKSSKW